MGTCHQSQAVVVVEGFGDILAECVSSASRGDSPSASVVGVTPEQVTHRALMGHFLDAIKRPDVVKGIDGRAQSTVKTEDLVFDESSEGKVVEEVGEVFPNISVAVFAEAFVIEAVDLCDLSGLVVSTEDGNTLRVTNLQGDQEGHSLN
jgi:hypothetical protein